jgi:peptidoglycan/LPS O-acetylase OafA/YrhL
MSFSNVPYWSLCYEFWYYVLFAVLTFTRGRKRLLWCCAVALLIGPKILLLAPVWATGVLLQRWTALQHVGRVAGALLLAASCIGYAPDRRRALAPAVRVLALLYNGLPAGGHRSLSFRRRARAGAAA